MITYDIIVPLVMFSKIGFVTVRTALNEISLNYIITWTVWFLTDMSNNIIRV